MAHHNFIVCDFETGGFDPTKNPVTEGAFIALNGVSLKEESYYEDLVLCYDDLTIEQDALDVTGITLNEINENGIDISLFVKNLVVFFKAQKSGKYRKPIIVAQNAPFEMLFLVSIFAREKLDLFDYVDRTPFCTQRASMQKWPNEATHKLPIICQRIGIEHMDAHRAMKDTQVTVDVFKYFMSQLRQDTEVKLSQGQKSLRKDFKFQLGE